YTTLFRSQQGIQVFAVYQALQCPELRRKIQQSRPLVCAELGEHNVADRATSQRLQHLVQSLPLGRQIARTRRHPRQTQQRAERLEVPAGKTLAPARIERKKRIRVLLGYTNPRPHG